MGYGNRQCFLPRCAFPGFFFFAAFLGAALAFFFFGRDFFLAADFLPRLAGDFLAAALRTTGGGCGAAKMPGWDWEHGPALLGEFRSKDGRARCNPKQVARTDVASRQRN